MLIGVVGALFVLGITLLVIAWMLWDMGIVGGLLGWVIRNLAANAHLLLIYGGLYVASPWLPDLALKIIVITTSVLYGMGGVVYLIACTACYLPPPNSPLTNRRLDRGTIMRGLKWRTTSAMGLFAVGAGIYLTVNWNILFNVFHGRKLAYRERQRFEQAWKNRGAVPTAVTSANSNVPKKHFEKR